MPLNEPRFTIPKFTIWIVVALIAGFLIGFLFEYAKLRRVEASLNQARTELKLGDLRDKLAEAHLEALARNFGNAQARAAEFFTRLQALTAASEDPSIQPALTAILQQRDEVMKLLAQSSPLAEPKLRQLMNDVYKATITRR